MNKTKEEILHNNFYSFCIPSGILIIYGDNMKMCVRCIDNVIDSVEDICSYCQIHNLKVYHKTNKNILGFIGFVQTLRLSKKYNVYSSWNDIKKYIITRSKAL